MPHEAFQNPFKQVWVNGVGLTTVLCEMGAWWVGCYPDKLPAIQAALEEGLACIRVHYGPGLPASGVKAYEVTDAGLEFLRTRVSEEHLDGITKRRQWYREFKKKWKGQR